MTGRAGPGLEWYGPARPRAVRLGPGEVRYVVERV